MSEELLGRVLRGAVSLNSVSQWLKTGSFQDDKFAAPCSRTDFVLFFLSYLRSQTTSILRKTPQVDVDIAVEKVKDEKIYCLNSKLPLSEETIILDQASEDCNDKKPLLINNLSPESHNNIKPDNKAATMNSISNSVHNNIKCPEGNAFVTPIKKLSAESVLMDMSPVNECSGRQNKSGIVFSTPNNSVTSNKSFENLGNQSSNDIARITDSQQKRMHLTPVNKNYGSKMQRHEHCEQSHRNFHPHEPRMITNSNNQQLFERPTSQRTNICIGDFIVSKSNTQERSVAKKKKHKYVNLSLDERHFTDRNGETRSNHFNFQDENSFPDIGSNKPVTRLQPRRRINPTRLNLSDQMSTNNSDGVGKKELKFGLKCDKIEQNEAFKILDSQSNEKDANFSAERNILKLEKEKLLQKFSTLGASSKSKTVVKLLPSHVSKSATQSNVNATLTILPSINDVSNKEALNILSVLYTLILDLNLVINFTSEINFLISLLVAQPTIPNETENVKDKHVTDNPIQQCSDFERNYFADNANVECLKPLIENGNKNSEPCSSNQSTKSNHEDLNISTLLTNIHNCVYFSLKTLSYQTDILDFILDQTTLRMLERNCRVKIFCPNLLDHFSKVLFLRRSSNETRQLQGVITNKNVCFITETDSEENFQSQQGFYTFKKQRDLFYDILRRWENQHNSANWNFTSKMGSMIKTLLNLSSNSTNMAHLARLFREQLIVTCTGRKTVDEDSLPEVAGASADRLSKLAQRLVAAPTRNLADQGSKPDFPGYQEFFRDFLINADVAGFRQHISDSLIEEIHRLNNTRFVKGENDKIMTNNIKQHYVSCVVTLQVLGKFLGLIMSLPYKSSEVSSPSSGQRNSIKVISQVTVPKDKVLESNIGVRCQTQPQINLLGVLENAKKHNILILTVPWVVQLLAVLDYSTLRLPYYKKVIHHLFFIYQLSVIENKFPPLELTSNTRMAVADSTTSFKISKSSRILLKISIGWFFDMLHFPQQLFFLWVKNVDIQELNLSISNYLIEDASLPHVDISNKMSSISMISETPSTIKDSHIKDKPRLCDNANEKIGDMTENKIVEMNLPNEIDITVKHYQDECILDFMDLIDSNVIFEFCPHVKELKCLLMANKDLFKTDSMSYRHITPVTSSLSEDALKKSKEKQLQTQLEEWFLRSQSQTTYRVLRSVAEKVGSALVKLVRTQIPHLKIRYIQSVEHVKQHSKEEMIPNDIQRLTAQLLIAFKTRCICAAKHCGRKRTMHALQGLLPSDMAKPVFDLLVLLSLRKSVESVAEWLNNEVTPDVLSLDKNLDKTKEGDSVDFESLEEYLNIEKYVTNQSGDVNKTSNLDASIDVQNSFCSAACCIVKLKELNLELLSGTALRKGLDETKLVFEDCMEYTLICSRCTHIQMTTKRTIGQLTVDLVVQIISLFPALLTYEILHKLKDIWQICLQTDISSVKIDLGLYENMAKCLINDELTIFNKYVCGDGQQQDSKTKIMGVNSSLPLLDEENILDDLPNVCDGKLEDNISIQETDLKSEKVEKNDDFFSTILCSRNILYFGELGAGTLNVWKKLSEFLVFLLKNKFLTEDSLTEQCLAIYRQEWPQKTLENLSTCIKDVSKMYNLKSEKLRLFLDFVVEFCHNISGDYSEL